MNVARFLGQVSEMSVKGVLFLMHNIWKIMAGAIILIAIISIISVMKNSKKEEGEDYFNKFIEESREDKNER